MTTPSISAQELQHLCALLGVPYDASLLPTPQEDILWQWKPIAERIALSNRPESEKIEMAQLLVKAGEASGRPACAALSLWISGNIFNRITYPRAANQQYKQAAVIYRSISDPLNLARMSVGWVGNLAAQGDFDEATELSSEIVPILTASPDETDQGRLMRLYTNIGIGLQGLGRYVEALKYYQSQYQWCLKHCHYELDGAKAQNSIAVVQLRLGQYWEALENFQLALAIFEKYADTSNIARVKVNLVRTHILRKAPIGIINTALNDAQQDRQALDPQTVARDLALLDLYEAGWLIETNRWRAIDRDRLLHTRAQCHTANLAFETACLDLLLGRLMLLDGNREDALVIFQRLEQLATAQGHEEIANRAGYWLARARRQLGEIAGAKQTLEMTLKRIEQTRHQLTSDEFRSGYLDDKLLVYHEYADIQLAEGNIPATFEVVERGKARTLAELLARQNQQLFQPTEQLATQSVEQIAAQLPNDMLAISYAIIHDKVWAFLINRNGLVTKPLDLGALLSPEMLKHPRILKGRQLLDTRIRLSVRQSIGSARVPLTQWYAQFLEPLQGWLGRYEKLLIAPDGLLNLLPFASLFDPKRQRYLIETHELQLTPSLATWAWLAHHAAQRRAQLDSVLAVGYNWQGQLPSALSEAQYVAAQFPHSVALLAAAATRQSFLQSAATADLIYISSHGEYHTDSPSFSHIELADGSITVADILQLNLKATAVVLSACDTAVGRLSGNEMMGLIRAFLYAGVSAVVATYWPVEDQTTFALMKEFVQALRAGQSVAHALKTAQCAFIQSEAEVRSHPFFWGGLSVMGYSGVHT